MVSVRVVTTALIMASTMPGIAYAKNLPKWSQGLWADNKFATCAELSSPDVFKDGGFLYVNGGRIGGHEWSCEAKRVLSNGEYSFSCGGEGEEFTGRGALRKDGRALVIEWSQFGMGPPKRDVWRFVDWCGKKGPAFWGN